MYAQPYAETYVAPPTYVAPTYAAPVPTYVPTYEVGKGSNFKKLNCCALLISLAIFAVLIAASTVCWYSYDDTYKGTYTNTATTANTITTLNYTRICFDLEGATTTVKTSTAAEQSLFSAYDSSSALWSIFKLVQAFVLIGLILAGLLAIFLLIIFADSIRNRLLFAVGMNVVRIVLFAIALFILISMIIAFLGFIGITNAFSDDTPGCTRGYCRRFSDSVEADRGTTNIISNGVSQSVVVSESTTFGPHAGWYLVLACIPLAIILCALVVVNKFPIPVDSVGSGEAL